MSIASDKLVKECEEKMLKTIEAVKEKFTAIRAGRANVSMLDGVKVENYGRALLAANLGMTPNNDGRVIRLVLPELTADRRKEYVKLAKNEAENGKIAVRNIRKDINNHLKKLEKDKENPISEDELKKEEANVQTLTDKYVKEIDELLAKKEKEITTI